MVTPDYCVLMARYNRWQNRKLYELCAQLSDAERRADRGAFFGSVHGTLNHLLYGDLAFLSRFTGDQPEAPPLGAELVEDFDALRATRERLDARLLDWCGGLSESWLRELLTYTSNVDGASRTRPRWQLVVHLFNHQTHHRGQLSTLLHQLGRDPGSTDLPFLPGEPDGAEPRADG